MPAKRFYPVLKVALIAGLAAGLVMGLFHFFFTEVVMDRAIALEGCACHDNAVPLVSRSFQKGMLVVGSALYGLIVGVIFALAFAVSERYLPGRRSDVKAVALTGLLWWSVAFLPFLKYPANPPGVGDPDTIYLRQSIQFGFIGLSALVVVAAGAIYWLLDRLGRESWLRRWRLGLAIGLYGILAILLFILMPSSSSPVSIAADLIWDFRILSLSGQVLFWITLGTISFFLLRRFTRQEVLGTTG